MSQTEESTKRLAFVVLIVTIYQEHFFGNQTQSRCSGSLIREDIVLTAAHCFIISQKIEPTSIKIQLLSGVMRNAHKLYIHPNYTDKGTDLAILTCPSTALKVLPKLPMEEIPEQAKCTAAGYGDPSPKLSTFKELEVNRSYVNSRYELINVGFIDRAPCKGDSGGPLICDGKIHGVLSRGSVSRCFMDYQAVMIYEEVLHHLNWIQPFLEAPIIPDNGNVNSLWVILLIFSLVVLITVFVVCYLTKR